MTIEAQGYLYPLALKKTTHCEEVQSVQDNSEVTISFSLH